MAVSKSTEKITNIIVSAGAAVVIFGAWAKILHLSFADMMLTVGLLTEAGIFVVYAYLATQGYGMHDDGHKAAGPAGTPALALRQISAAWVKISKSSTALLAVLKM